MPPRRFTREQEEHKSITGLVSAYLRLQQNLAVFDTLEGATVQRASIMFQRWKAIGQVNARRAILLVRRKVPSKTVLQFVYRSVQYALEDWSSRLRHALGIGKRVPMLRDILFDTRLKLDFLDRVLIQGAVFSLPRIPPDTVGQEEARLSLVTADAVLHARSECLSYFCCCRETRLATEAPFHGDRTSFPAHALPGIRPVVHSCPRLSAAVGGPRLASCWCATSV